MEYILIEDIFSWSEDPLNTCAGQPVIMGTSFSDLAHIIATNYVTKLTEDEINALFLEQAKRFSACGGNFANVKTGVLRKSPENGWAYLINLIIKEKPLV